MIFPMLDKLQDVHNPKPGSRPTQCVEQRGIMINDHSSTVSGRLLRPRLLAVEPNLFPYYDTQISYLMFFHVLAQLLISLILMNLVVALINDALVKSLTKKDQEYFKETNLLIIYCEKIKNFMNICPS